MGRESWEKVGMEGLGWVDDGESAAVPPTVGLMNRHSNTDWSMYLYDALPLQIETLYNDHLNGRSHFLIR